MKWLYSLTAVWCRVSEHISFLKSGLHWIFFQTCRGTMLSFSFFFFLYFFPSSCQYLASILFVFLSANLFVSVKKCLLVAFQKRKPFFGFLNCSYLEHFVSAQSKLYNHRCLSRFSFFQNILSWSKSSDGVWNFSCHLVEVSSVLVNREAPFNFNFK